MSDTANERPHAHETDCSEVLADLSVFLDHECDDGRKQLLQRHLDDCGPCLERLGIEQQLKELLHRKCGGDLAPDDLKQRLRVSIRQVSVTMRTEEQG